MPAPLAKPKKNHATVHFITPDQFDTFKAGLDKHHKNQISSLNMSGSSAQNCFLYGKDNAPDLFFSILSETPSFFDGARMADYLASTLSPDTLKNTSFEIQTDSLNEEQIFQLNLGWAMHDDGYKDFKASTKQSAPLVITDKNMHTRVHHHREALSRLRHLVNSPANVMGPEELEFAVQKLGKAHKAKINCIRDQELLDKNFPLIYTVGMAAGAKRRPRLIDLRWGNKKHPKITLVGKGVCFDTGGLDLKPSKFMRFMKKDMGGAAHALAVAELVMALKLPVYLRLLIPAVENAVSSDAFRPGDVITARNGKTVENTNTDAEGRLILADALSYACEDQPELIIDFATLTGSARAALGPDIPAMFSTDREIGQNLEALSQTAQDPLWQMPLHDHYRRFIDSSVADLVNSAGVPGDLIYSALFLKEFVDSEKADWVHIDCYAWEESGRPGRPKGAADTGARAVFQFLETKYGAS